MGGGGGDSGGGEGEEGVANVARFMEPTPPLIVYLRTRQGGHRQWQREYNPTEQNRGESTNQTEHERSGGVQFFLFKVITAARPARVT